VSGKRSKQRRRQQRAAAGRSRGPGEADRICALYRTPPRGALYREWVQFADPDHPERWLERAMRAPGADQEPGALDWAHRVAAFAAVYGQMIPADAACHLDLHLDSGTLPVQHPVQRGQDHAPAQVPAAEIARALPGIDPRSELEVRFAVHQLHALGRLNLLDDGTVILLAPDSQPKTGSGTSQPS
jgi:hypothetical protein